VNRVKVIYGTNPFLVIAPHGGGPTDLRSALISDIIAKQVGAFAVINHGWERKSTPNFRLGYANCNDITHCQQEPLLSEFLTPIDELRSIILTKYNKVYLFLVHGMDNKIRNYNGIDIVLGYGAGKPSRHTCTLCFKDRLMSCLSLENFTPAQGKSGGRLSGWNKDNLNQLYQGNNQVESIQMEIALTLRKSNSVAKNAAIRIGEAIIRTCDNSRFVPSIAKIREI
jgi:hypothetical protein